MTEFEALLARANEVGVVPTFAKKLDDERMVTQRTQDVEPLLRKLDDMRIDGKDGYTEDRDLLYVGEIPMTVVEQWCYANGIHPGRMLKNDDELVQRMVNDPEIRKFRLFNGRW